MWEIEFFLRTSMVFTRKSLHRKVFLTSEMNVARMHKKTLQVIALTSKNLTLITKIIKHNPSFFDIQGVVIDCTRFFSLDTQSSY